ncbi:MAG: HU family DNA-binding protein [Pseudomonadota bacterium]
MVVKKSTAKASGAKAAVKKSEKVEKVKKPVKSAALTEPMKKSEMLLSIAETTGLNKKQVQSVLDELVEIIERHVKKKGGVGQFVLPGVLKISVQNKPAVKARKGINPFNGEETMFKAKPARNVVKIRPLKKLKEMTN